MNATLLAIATIRSGIIVLMKNAENTSTAASQPATMIHTCYLPFARRARPSATRASGGLSHKREERGDKARASRCTPFPGSRLGSSPKRDRSSSSDGRQRRRPGLSDRRATRRRAHCQVQWAHLGSNASPHGRSQTRPHPDHTTDTPGGTYDPSNPHGSARPAWLVAHSVSVPESPRARIRGPGEGAAHGEQDPPAVRGLKLAQRVLCVVERTACHPDRVTGSPLRVLALLLVPALELLLLPTSRGRGRHTLGLSPVAISIPRTPPELDLLVI
jgi:hypothetical protein